MNKLWAYFKTKEFLRNFLGAVGVVISVVLIAFFSLSFYTNHGSGVPVPKLKGLTIEQAIERLKDQGFDYRVDSVYVGDAPAGTVVEQDPDPGTNVKENRVIYLTMVTRQAPAIELPNIEDSQYISAVATLSTAGLKVGDTTYRADVGLDRVLEVTLVGQILKPGTKVPKGSRIDLVLGDGKGANVVEIPNLVGQDIDAARFVIGSSGLTLGTITYQGAITDSANIVVVNQFPLPTDSASTVSKGTAINLMVTQGKNQ